MARSADDLDMDNEPPRRSFREIYRAERAKVRDEKARGGNRYADWLLAIAIIGLGLGVAGPLINTVVGEPDFYGRAPEFDPLNPAFVIGGACLVLWLAVKANTSQQAPPR